MQPHGKSGKHPQHAMSTVRVNTLSKPGRYADGNGLYLVVDPSGAKRWVLRTVIGGKRRDLGLGGYTVVPLAEARKEAARLRGIARSGGDPLTQRRKERRSIPTFAEAAREVHKLHSPAWKNAKHSIEWLRSLEVHVFPALRDMRVDLVSQADVLKALSALWLQKPETGRRIKQRIRLVLSWAKARGFRSGDNPVEGLSTVLPAQTDKPVHHAAMPYAEIPAFVHKLRKSDTLPIVKLAFEFLILTACRTNEVLGAQWSEFDLDKALWAIPPARMKAKREHRVPLSPRCIEILNEAKGFDYRRGLYVFSNPATGEKLSNMALLMIMKRAKFPYVPHGFRSSFRDWAAERTNTPSAVMEAALAHAEHDKTVAAYARSDLFERRTKLMEKWQQHCMAAKAEIVPIGLRQA